MSCGPQDGMWIYKLSSRDLEQSPQQQDQPRLEKSMLSGIPCMATDKLRHLVNQDPPLARVQNACSPRRIKSGQR
ncbi:hypothetical protein T265_01794 [Opisthorchis viverrini]|uniref:Uncharacterized protein n=1 Tax=Opisthorchis viverrini TaxID=6198 RepID=A0A075A8F8_OPIVI|nr:hypothetical protein T265_01794 [Opisthorchis viverrini]KER32010.1 hypothetical protein T265_01794 [Opisthorchis viverrini]